MPASLTKEEAYEFLDSRPGWIILTTVGRDGFPHSVPIGYFRLGMRSTSAAGRAPSARRTSKATPT